MADYMYVDADNHYYEAEDAFIRHGDQDVKRYVRWVSEGKRRYLVFGSTMIGLANTSVPNPTFNPIATPGAFHTRLKELQERSHAAARSRAFRGGRTCGRAGGRRWPRGRSGPRRGPYRSAQGAGRQSRWPSSPARSPRRRR